MSGPTGDTSLGDALAHVERLDDLLVNVVEDQPSVEAQVGSLQYHVNFNTNFEDRNGFVTGIARYMEEATVQTALNELLEEGDLHAVNLYTWRCCTRSIPQPMSNEDPNREAIHATTVQVLGPEVDKLYDLVRFQRVAIDRFCVEVRILSQAEKRKEFVSSAYLLTLGKLINMFAIIDELKNIKASVKIDFSSFRRAAQVLRILSDSQKLQESQNLSVFLATPNKIRANLAENLDKIPNSEEVLADVVNICVNMFEQRLFITVEEKHMLVKVIGFCVALLDESRQLYKLDSRGRLKLEKIDKIFSSLPVVPLFGDMQISPFNNVFKSPFYEASKWPLSSGGSGGNSPSRIDLVKLLPQISLDHMRYLSELQGQSLVLTAKDQRGSEEDDESASRLALRGLQLLSEWTSAVLELHSWKLMHPTDAHQNNACPQDAEEYERATKYNYSDQEKSALVKIIGMIKGLQAILAKLETSLSDGIRRHVYQKLQNFVQKTLREAVRKSVKHKKHVLNSVLTSIRDCCAEWITDGALPSNDPATKGEKTPLEIHTLKRAVGPSSTQLYLLRTMVESIVSDKMCARRHLRKDVDQHHLPLIEDFQRMSFFWGYLLNFGVVLSKCCDLGALWYREFYLELTMGRRVQFPIEMSMPWILIDHLLEKPDLIEFAMYSFDLYNDSANWALHMYRKQWIFDELLAEVNLSLDQFLFKLSSQVFKYYKQLAGANSLGRKFKNDWAIATDESLDPRPIKYEGLIQQRRAYLLGHYLDLNELIRQRISVDMLQSLQSAIDKFEEGDISHIVILEALLRVNQETHKILSKWFPSLDKFENFWNEANQSVSGGPGRVALHICNELSSDFVPDFCYNSSTNRFVRGVGMSNTRIKARPPGKLTPPQYMFGTKQLNTVYSLAYSNYTGFVGEPHFRAMADLLGYKGVGFVVRELLALCEKLIGGGMSQWMRVIKDSLLPKFVKAPRKVLTEEGLEGLLGFYLNVLNSVIQNPKVKLDLFQHFREVGNSVLFVLLVEQALGIKETWMTCQAFPFQGSTKDLKGEQDDQPASSDKIKRIALIKALHIYGNIEKFGTETQRKLTAESDLLTSELLTMGLRLFPEILRNIKACLLKDIEENGHNVWTGQPPTNHVMNMHRCGEFHRIWSALQFICCIPVGPHEASVEQLYGDGLHWAGCLFVELLDQTTRFKVFDFCYNLWDSYQNEKDSVPETIRGMNVKQLMGKARAIQAVSDRVFATVRKYMNEANIYELVTTGRVPENVKCFLPPVHKLLLTKEDLSPNITAALPEVVRKARQELFPSELPPPPSEEEDEAVLERVGSSDDSIEVSTTTTTADLIILDDNFEEEDKSVASSEKRNALDIPQVNLLETKEEALHAEVAAEPQCTSVVAPPTPTTDEEKKPQRPTSVSLVEVKDESQVTSAAMCLIKLEDEKIETYVQDFNFLNDELSPQNSSLEEKQEIVAVEDQVESSTDILFQCQQIDLESASVSSVIDPSGDKFILK